MKKNLLKKLAITAVMLLFLVGTLSGSIFAAVAGDPAENGGGDKVPVTSIKGLPSSISMSVGRSITIKASVEPANATVKTITWSSNNSSIASVSGGTVTAKSPGSVTITAYCDGVSAKCTVTVRPCSSGYTISGHTVTKELKKLVKGHQEVGKCTKCRTSWDITPVEPHTPGTMLKLNSNGDVVQECTVCGFEIISPKIPVTSVKVAPANATLTKGESITLKATVSPSNATNKTVVWNSDNTKVATVKNGTVEAIGAGSATISAIADGKMAQCKVTVEEPEVQPPVQEKCSQGNIISGHTIAKELKKLVKGHYEVEKCKICETSWDITPVEPHTPGTVLKLNSNGDVVQECTVCGFEIISPKIPVTSVKVAPANATLTKGQYITLKATVSPSDATNKTVVWGSNNTKVATVKNGTVKAIAAGYATITVTVDGKIAQCKVTVKEPEVQPPVQEKCSQGNIISGHAILKDYDYTSTRHTKIEKCKICGTQWNAYSENHKFDGTVTLKSDGKKVEICTICKYEKVVAENIKCSSEKIISGHENSIEIIAYLNKNETTHTVQVKCKSCDSDPWEFKEKHEYDKNDICKCGMKNEIKATKLSFDKTDITVKTGGKDSLGNYLNIKPINATVDLRWEIAGGDSNSLILGIYNGKIYPLKVAEGVVIGVRDNISGKKATITVNIVAGSDWSELVSDIGDFDDLKEDFWYIPYIEDVLKDKIFNGTSENTFSPDDFITRGMFVTALARFDGAETGDYESVFQDVPDSAYYKDSINWAFSIGIVNGVGEGKFAPDKYITRQEMATILYNYIKINQKGLLADVSEAENNFKDKDDIASWAKEAVDILNQLGIIVGKEDGRFMPLDNVTRAQAAAVISRLSDMTKTKVDEDEIIVEEPKEEEPKEEEPKEEEPKEEEPKEEEPKEEEPKEEEPKEEKPIIDESRHIYSPKDFGNSKPKMEAGCYKDEEWAKMEKELADRVKKAGFGTRAGAVEAALFLAELDYAVPYRGSPRQAHNYIGVYNKIGLNRTWGKVVKLYSAEYPNGYREVNGMDCGAFVTWALVNGGVLKEGETIYAHPNNYSKTSPKHIQEIGDEIEPGDFAFTKSYQDDSTTVHWSHVGLVVGVDEENVYVAELTTGKYRKLIVTKISKNTSLKTNKLAYYSKGDSKVYKAKNSDGTENKGNMSIVW